MRKNRILVIDDDVHATRMTRLVLERTGRYEVRELNESDQALGAAWEFEPDLILLDVCMPNVEGSEVAEKITHHPALASTPIVFLTCIVTPGEAGPNGSVGLVHHPMEGIGPWFSYDRADWHRRQLIDVRRAGIDVILPEQLQSRLNRQSPI